jgi:hypothetical protein
VKGSRTVQCLGGGSAPSSFGGGEASRAAVRNGDSGAQ